MMGGTIAVQSTPEEGSVFRVELPVEQSSKPETVEARPNDKYVVGLAPGQPEYRILIVEDKKENWMLLQRLLQEAGFLPQVVEDGAQAVEAFRTWKPHLIWMDISLPVMGGMEAAARIRALEGGAQVRIVALSASVFAHQRDEALATGIDDFLPKPYRREEIFECMARHLGVRYIYREVAPTSNPDKIAPVGPEDIARLPRNLRDELAHALVRLDAGPIYEVIGRVSAQDAQLGALLASCAKRFAYTEVLNAIEECDGRLRAGANRE
jgi:CheY-like chemotaxis protein